MSRGACQQCLRPGLQRSLIVIATPALVLGRKDTPRRALSPPVVLRGSMNSTSRRAILPPSKCFLFLFFSCLLLWGCCASPSLSGQVALSLKRGPHYRLRTFNRSNHLLRSLPWYYRACWHQNLAQIALAWVGLTRPPPRGRPLTISAWGHWIVCAPAASLDYESTLSGFLCGIGP